MFEIRRAQDRGVADFGWLDSRHTFSFGHYHDPRYMGFGPLRVINEDRVHPGRGFDAHRHQHMEIITYVLDGAPEHRDSTGSGSVIRPGDVQRMSAGSGIVHSEFNASARESAHFLQRWILPGRRDLAPSYEKKHFSEPDKLGQWRPIGSADGWEGSITIHQDVDLYATVLDPGQALSRHLSGKRKIWLQLVRGGPRVDGEALSAGDGVVIQHNGSIALSAMSTAEFLLFDMADSP